MDAWEKLKVMSGVIAAVIIPLASVYIGNQYSSAIKQRETQGRFVELAVEVLREKPTPEQASLRQWAISVIDKYSGVEMSADAKAKLIRIPLPFSSELRVPLWQETTPNVSAKDLEATVRNLMVSGAAQITKWKQADGRYTVVGTK